MHLDEEHLQRVLHAELSRMEEAVVREHLAACEECRQRLAAAEREEAEVATLLHTLDGPVPAIEAEDVALRARPMPHRFHRWVAGILLAAGVAGAACAIPGSPVPRWAQAVREWMVRGRAPSVPVQGSGESTEKSPSGIAIAPGPRLSILFESPLSGGIVQVSLTDAAEAAIRAPSGSATFTSAADRIVVAGRGRATTFDVQLPRTAPFVEIRAGGRRIFLKEGAQVTAGTPPDANGFYSLRLSP